MDTEVDCAAQAAVAAESLTETATFDAKRELATGAKANAKLAVDVAAMSTDGGVIVFGIGELDGYPAQARPLALEGLADRVSQVVETRLAEPPVIDVTELRNGRQPSQGYLVVAVPASARAPHQVIADGRYYGRNARGNRVLGEGEVARLYSRRQASEIDARQHLEACVASAPLQPQNGAGYLHIFVRPLLATPELGVDALRVMAGERSGLLSTLRTAAGRAVLQGYAPCLGECDRFQQIDADTWRWFSEPVYEDRAPEPSDVTQLEIHASGEVRTFNGRASDVPPISGGPSLLIEELIAGELEQTLLVASAMYEAVGYVGPVDVGVAVTGIKSARALVNRYSPRAPYAWPGDGHHATRRIVASDLARPRGTVEAVLGRFFQAASQRADFSPYADADAA